MTFETGTLMTDIPPRTYPFGVTSWIDTDQPDPDAAALFYGELFGWTFSNAMPPTAESVYLIAQHDGQDAAAIATGVGPAAWNTYIATDDADKTAAAIAAAGGTVLHGPENVGRDVGQAGRMVLCADPQGAQFRLWQASRRLGAQAVNGPGCWNFSDLRTTDEHAAKAFYTQVFGWRYLDFGATVETMIAVDGYGEYLAATADPGIFERQAGAPAGFADVIGALEQVPDAGAEGGAADGAEAAHWRVKFSVADRAASLDLVRELAGTVLGTEDQMWALLADIRDPQGAEFTISQFRQPGETG